MKNEVFVISSRNGRACQQCDIEIESLSTIFLKRFQLFSYGLPVASRPQSRSEVEKFNFYCYGFSTCFRWHFGKSFSLVLNFTKFAI